GEADIQIVSRLIEGQFPNYQRVIPAAHQKKLTVEVDALLRAFRRASIIARENAHRIVFRTDDDKLVLTAERPMVGNARARAAFRPGCCRHWSAPRIIAGLVRLVK